MAMTDEQIEARTQALYQAAWILKHAQTDGDIVVPKGINPVLFDKEVTRIVKQLENRADSL